VIPLFVPRLSPDSGIGTVREHVTADGVTMRVTILDVVRDEAARNQTAQLRYELLTGHDHHMADRSWTLHWIEQDDVTQMAADAGLTTRSVRGEHGSPATSHDTACTFIVGLG
jgi:hypothetical protein